MRRAVIPVILTFLLVLLSFPRPALADENPDIPSSEAITLDKNGNVIADTDSQSVLTVNLPAELAGYTLEAENADGVPFVKTQVDASGSAVFRLPNAVREATVSITSNRPASLGAAGGRKTYSAVSLIPAALAGAAAGALAVWIRSRLTVSRLKAELREYEFDSRIDDQ